MKFTVTIGKDVSAPSSAAEKFYAHQVITNIVADGDVLSRTAVRVRRFTNPFAAWRAYRYWRRQAKTDPRLSVTIKWGGANTISVEMPAAAAAASMFAPRVPAPRPLPID